MKKITKIFAIILVTAITSIYPFAIANAVTCFFQYEQTSGMNKICIYNCMGSSAAITIGATGLCPLSINR